MLMISPRPYRSKYRSLIWIKEADKSSISSIFYFRGGRGDGDFPSPVQVKVQKFDLDKGSG